MDLKDVEGFAVRCCAITMMVLVFFGCTVPMKHRDITVTGRVVGERDGRAIPGAIVSLRILRPGFVMGSYRKVAEQHSAPDGRFRFAVPAGVPFVIESKDPGEEVFGGGFRSFGEAKEGMFVELKHKNSIRLRTQPPQR